jgi:hypothetical protein
MKKKIIGIFVMTLFVATTLTPFYDSSVEAKVTYQNGKLNDNANWVVLFYQNGDNALSNYIDICLDLIEEVGATDDVKIAVLIDKLPLNDTKLYYYEGKTPIEQDWPAESDMSDPETLIQFVQKVKNDLPSDHYCLEITANKGSGWQGVSYDEHGDGIMITMPEIHYALDTITENGCFKLDVLLLQSCVGGNLEFRYQVSQFVNYYVGYADCGVLGDIPFDSILADVVANPLMDAKQFAINVVNHFTPQQIQNIYQAMGATDSLKLDELTQSIDYLAVWFIDNIDTYKSDISTALSQTRKYGLQFGIDYFIDLKDFLEHLNIGNANYITIKNSILNNIEQAVIANVTLEGHPSCGFNFYYPNKKQDYNSALRYDHALPSSYEETLFAKDTHWDEFLKIFLGLQDNTAPSVPGINGPNKGKPGQKYDYVLSADDPQGDTVCFYIEWGDGTFEWTNLDVSGEQITVSHVWESKGTYTVRVKAIDQYCASSGWETLSIKIPRSRAVYNLPLKFLDNHPLLFRLLQILFN